MKLNKRIFAVMAVAVLSLFVLAACGGGGGGGGSSNGGGTATDGTIKIELGPGFAFNPNRIEVPVNQEVTLQLENVNSIDHDFILEAFGVASDTLGGGEAQSLSFTPGQTGEYEFYCSIPGHREGGMVGTLVVTE